MGGGGKAAVGRLRHRAANCVLVLSLWSGPQDQNSGSPVHLSGTTPFKTKSNQGYFWKK